MCFLHSSKTRELGKHVPSVCVATASPIKFPEAVKAAGIEVPQAREIAMLLGKATRYEEIKQGQDWDKIVRNKIQSVHRVKLQ